MCGIVGYIKRGGPVFDVDEQHLHSALARISYRGPDGEGIWRFSNSILGHRRLSIIDLSDTGRQPFEIVERGLVIIFNGEIYNYRQIRSTLTSFGYSFRSESDTEVLLLAYDHYGVDFLHHLRGMFSLCIYDIKRKKVLLARDPMGEKPLYYFFDPERFVFSSEIKAFHAFPEIGLSIDVESVKAFFSLQYIPGSSSIYSDIKRLPAGSMLELDLVSWGITQQKYWQIKFDDVPSVPEEVDHLISESVKYRLVADVEVGLLLSGGIDSALLASYASKNGAQLRTFTAAFDERDLDESQYAQQVVDYLGLQRIFVTGGRLTPELFDKVIFHGDELIGDPACVPTFLLSQEISRHVKVVMSGEGADELFWGYDTYRFERIWRWFLWARILFSRSSGFQDVVASWDVTSHLPAGLVRLGKILSASHDIGASRWTTIFADQSVQKLIPIDGAGVQMAYLQEMEQQIHEFERQVGYFKASLSTDLLYWLVDDLLLKADRMTMGNGVEARAPYLDPDLILRALALPRPQKLGAGRGKLVLRHLVENHFSGTVGKNLAWRRKHGFEVPVDFWLRNNLHDCVEERLSPAKLAKSGFFNIEYVGRLKKEFYASPRGAVVRRKIWLLLCFQTWFEFHENGFGLR